MYIPNPQTQARLDELLGKLQEYSSNFVGYPCNQNFDYARLLPFLRYVINNVGDPFNDSYFRSNTHEIEREVIAKFAELMKLPQSEAWGYVTNGGTEGNMHGLFLARELFPDGIVYFSSETHYSVVKITRVLNMRNIMIKSQENGEIDYDTLYEALQIYKDIPAIFMANIGTTMKGAVDNVHKVKSIFNELGIEQHYIHADEALSGMILPFVDNPQPYGFNDGIDSVAISGHKLIGSPVPCGVILTKRQYVAKIARAIEYVGIMDTTLPGSRNALTPIILWYAFERYGIEGYKLMVKEMLDTAEYAVQCFHEQGIPAWRNENSVTVVIPRPSDEVLHKWQLAPQANIAHIITMQHVTREMIDEIVSDCVNGISETQLKEIHK